MKTLADNTVAARTDRPSQRGERTAGGQDTWISALAGNRASTSPVQRFQHMANWSPNALQLKRQAEAMSAGSRSAGDTRVQRMTGMPQRATQLQQPAAGEVLQRQSHAVIQLGGKPSKSDEDAIIQREYEKQVNKAVGLLSKKIAFGASPEAKFDERYWKKVKDPQYGFAIQATIKPSEAIKQLIAAGSGVWAFDCAEYVQVCNLYATMQVYGEEAIDGMDGNQELILRQHDSTPFAKFGIEFVRESGDAKFELILKFKGNAFEKDFIDESTLLDNTPAGSRVCFKNPAGEGTPFRNENAIAIGKGKYAAHPMGTDLSAGQIKQELVMYNSKLKLGGDDSGESQIFISQVEMYKSILLDDATFQALQLTQFAKFFDRT